VSLEQVRESFASVTALQPDASRPWRRWLRFEQERLRDMPDDAPFKEREETARLGRDALEAAREADSRDLVTLRLGAELMRRAQVTGIDPTRRQADREAFFELMEALLERDPLDVEARFQLASEWHRVGRTDRRDAELDQVFQLEPDYAWAWYQRARMLDRDEDPEAALHAYVRTMEAVMNCRVKVRVDNPRSQRFYRKNLDQVDSKRVWLRVYELRQEVYF
jgi:tetratricopeptide (TPR) repeat protein